VSLCTLQNGELGGRCTTLATNISALYNTAKLELQRKDTEIQQLRERWADQGEVGGDLLELCLGGWVGVRAAPVCGKGRSWLWLWRWRVPVSGAEALADRQGGGIACWWEGGSRQQLHVGVASYM
jgi:hypothetical protein